ncbi:hypothetical protein [Streptomyces sp. NPDC097619]|uniref:hypothetical protein n=1 Tax=Streptomyces sp. NPDC097619 TaxID=3157228 RepID=UPI0033178D8D
MITPSGPRPAPHARPAHPTRPAHPAHPARRGTPSRSPVRRPALPVRAERLALRQHGLLTTGQLRGEGVSAATIARRSRPGGPWQRLLPRVHLLQTGPPDARQRALAAVLYAAGPAADRPPGAAAALTGGAALALIGVREAPAVPAHVLVRAPRTVVPVAGVVPVSTRRWPVTITVSGVPSVRPLRAAADFALRSEDPDLTRSVLARVVQSGWCHPEDLHAELRAARALRRPAVSGAAAELLAGVRSPAEGRAREALAGTDLPAPLWNARLYAPDGAFLASPDAYWPDEGVALEVDSAEYHYTRDAWQATLRRRLRLESYGVLVASTAPALLRASPELVVASLRALLALGGSRSAPPALRTRGHAQLELPL